MRHVELLILLAEGAPIPGLHVHMVIFPLNGDRFRPNLSTPTLPTLL
jgi:hypothetical protein